MKCPPLQHYIEIRKRSQFTFAVDSKTLIKKRNDLSRKRVNIWANFFSITWNLIIEKSVSIQLKNVFLNIDQSYIKKTQFYLPTLHSTGRGYLCKILQNFFFCFSLGQTKQKFKNKSPSIHVKILIKYH